MEQGIFCINQRWPAYGGIKVKIGKGTAEKLALPRGFEPLFPP